jgi:hypothetical protein
MISTNLQGESEMSLDYSRGDLTLAAIDGIILKIHIIKALMETSMLLVRSQRTRAGGSRAISNGRKSFLSAN